MHAESRESIAHCLDILPLSSVMSILLRITMALCTQPKFKKL